MSGSKRTKNDESNDIDDADWEELVERHLHGELDETEKARLAELLDKDAVKRQDFVRRASWDTEVSGLMRGASPDSNRRGHDSAELNEASEPGSFDRQAANTLRALLAVAATTILVLAFLLFQEKSATRDVATKKSRPAVAKISGLSGSLIWTGDRGEIVRDIRVGTELAGGTIEGLLPDSWFELQFNDGSEVTISGASLLTFSDDGQKTLRLREGRMSADVNPQPPGKPMLIHTRTALLTVLGTSFDVEAELPSTTVNVREGTVRVTRSSDGEAVDVPAQHRVVASADEAFERQQVSGVVRHWSSRLDAGPDETFGQWQADTDDQPAFLKAVAFVPEQAPHVLLHLLGLGVRTQDGSPIQVTKESQIEIRGQMDLDTVVYVGLQVADASGDYAGKFRAECQVQRDEAGRFVARASLPQFELDPSVAAYRDKLAPSPEDLYVTGTWCFTHSKKPSGLRISQIQITIPD
ncbi:MAG: hypothetical protein Aurels2KO_12060 [Aureliella sp.]